LLGKFCSLQIVIYTQLLYFRVPVAHKKYILNSGEYLNYIEIENDKAKTDSNPSTLVLMHGYGSGLAFFFGTTNYIILITLL
jgi:hypothetical protein